MPATAKASNDVEETEEPKAAKKPAEAPKAETKKEAPKAEPVKEAPKAEAKKEAPKEEAKKPAEEAKKEAPKKAEPKPEAKPVEAPKAEAKKTYRDEVRSEIVIKHGNIVALACDAIVNATTNTLLGGPGTDNTILRAGGPELLRECAALKGCDVGRAKISRGYRLKAGYVIHTVGPKYSGDDSDPVYLTMCYENCLNLAMKYDLHTIAFPPISTGYFGYPLREATMIAGRTVQGWMRRHPEYGIKVYFVSADERTFAMYREILSAGK
ncbi:MAG: macro domain-containing protein [Lachnospiraceae bacterium]|nr:macro domain-containing protein [Lachnospiraceae bacterium]